MTISWPLSRQQVLDANGRPYLPAYAEFYAGGTTTPLTVYADAALTVPLTQPVQADGTGRFPRVYLPAGLYAERVLGPYSEVIWFDDDLGEAVEVSTGEPAPTVDPFGVAATGDVKWRMDAAILPGWVRMNGRTLGAAGSGATEFADASASALFTFLWTTFADTIASVVGGRGASAAADFSAGKQITIPTMQGLTAAGLDDMGSSPAGRMQTITNITLTAGSTTATVADSSRLIRGMVVIATGISAGTVVTGISGATITLSQPAAAGSTGTVQGRFSFMGDAQNPGQAGGDIICVLGVDQIPVITPTGTLDGAPDHAHSTNYNVQNAYGAGSGGAVITVGQTPANSTAPTSAAGAHNHAFHGDPFGGGQAHTNLQPTRLGTYYMKV
jgi:hypothetical protein